jgi:lycopene cyclase domain-containing protein
MTYFGFLAVFLVIPILILGLIAWRDDRRGRRLPPVLSTWSPYVVIAFHCLVALVYTTPWDNYLVATRVWWYHPELVTGIVIGWVPIEEYTFFVLQPILTGLWLLFLARRLSPPPAVIATPHAAMQRWGGLAIFAALWIGSVTILFMGSQPLTYLALLMAWALPPLMLQFAFGGDILWHYRKLILLTLIPATVYLCVADAIAIESGTWTINPQQSVNFFVGGLPFEEIVFFLMTNVMISVGITLALARQSQERVPAALLALLGRLSRRPAPAGQS